MHIETIAAWATIIDAALATALKLWRIMRQPHRAASVHAG